MCLNPKLQNTLLKSENHTVSTSFAKCPSIVSDFIIPSFPYQPLSLSSFWSSQPSASSYPTFGWWYILLMSADISRTHHIVTSWMKVHLKKICKLCLSGRLAKCESLSGVVIHIIKKIRELTVVCYINHKSFNCYFSSWHSNVSFNLSIRTQNKNLWSSS